MIEFPLNESQIRAAVHAYLVSKHGIAPLKLSVGVTTEREPTGHGMHEDYRTVVSARGFYDDGDSE
jgi:hypothetical protein